jgi:hypothetical protein
MSITFGEPSPQAGKGDIWKDIIDALPTMSIKACGVDGVQKLEKLIALCRARREMGIAKYGTPLQYQNGRNPKKDLMEELLDAVVYAKQAGYSQLSEHLLETILQYDLQELMEEQR